MFEHTRDGDVHVLAMRNGENLMDPGFFRGLHAALDEVEAESEGNAALVLTGDGKYFSNGLNLPVIGAMEPAALADMGRELMRSMGRLLVFPVPTVAALNGHAFAGGAILAAACDYRVMRENRGWICVAEVDVGVPIDPALMRILETRLSPQTLRTSVLEGRRFAAAEALESGWVDAVAAEADLLASATKQAASLAGKGRDIFGSLKRSLWGDVARGLGFEPGKT